MLLLLLLLLLAAVYPYASTNQKSLPGLFDRWDHFAAPCASCKSGRCREY
jgi:hypothetical protein